jgi:hypothetical protein
VACGVEVVDRKGEVEGLQRHALMILSEVGGWPARSALATCGV